MMEAGRAPKGIVAIGSGLTGLGAAATAGAAGLCCIGPGAVSLLGVSGAIAAAGLAPYRPLLLLGSLAFLLVAFWLTYRSPALAGTGTSCPTRAGRISRAILWVAAVLWLAAALLPWVLTR